MKLGVAAAPMCTHPLIPSVRNQKLLPTCISACRRVGYPSVDPVCVQMHRADNGGWTRFIVVKKSVGIPKKKKKHTGFVDAVRRMFRNCTFLFALYLLYFFFLLLSFILLVFLFIGSSSTLIFLTFPFLQLPESPSPIFPIILTFLFLFVIRTESQETLSKSSIICREEKRRRMTDSRR